ncbi:hypothetical protein FHR81_004549 [Actinoalloteichus hoggarensis]|uniref:Uncharacterized protein n=1 Tax=Actinoalloteichus hoggarensis TaxID=1470176 RepID=A0A221W4C5_9PSEU|nr:hypothetical protein [Actinoalloteichus hoggarensis]ASO20439.1 hypothetical protein AHOG_13980 [Actinoalloteichus hoggarensis]MBB5923478.1 hypothetical protein [Actinoalloteichus hoggarensis]
MIWKRYGTPRTPSVAVAVAVVLASTAWTAAGHPASAAEDADACIAFALVRGVDERTAATACDANTTTAQRCRELLGPFMSGREAAEACRIR